MTYPTLYLIQLKCFLTLFHSLTFNSLSFCDPPMLCPKTRALISSSFALQFSALHPTSFRTVRLANDQHHNVCTPLTIPSPLSLLLRFTQVMAMLRPSLFWCRPALYPSSQALPTSTTGTNKRALRPRLPCFLNGDVFSSSFPPPLLLLS